MYCFSIPRYLSQPLASQASCCQISHIHTSQKVGMIFQKGGPNTQQNPEMTGGSGWWLPTHHRTAGDIPKQTKEKKELRPDSRCPEIQS